MLANDNYKSMYDQPNFKPTHRDLTTFIGSLGNKIHTDTDKERIERQCGHLPQQGRRHYVRLFCHHCENWTSFHQETVHQDNTNMTEFEINCFSGMSDLRGTLRGQTIPFPKDIIGRKKWYSKRSEMETRNLISELLTQNLDSPIQMECLHVVWAPFSSETHHPTWNEALIKCGIAPDPSLAMWLRIFLPSGSCVNFSFRVALTPTSLCQPWFTCDDRGGLCRCDAPTLSSAITSSITIVIVRVIVTSR